MGFDFLLFLYSRSKGQFEGQIYAQMCNLILAGEYLSGISVVIQSHPQGQKVNFKVTKCENVIQKENTGHDRT